MVIHNIYDFVSIEKLPKTSTNTKKFEVILKNLNTNRLKSIKFGDNRYEHYTDGHLDEERRQKYINRHKTNEKWGINGLHTAGFWSYNFLWRFKTYKEALDFILKEYFFI